MEKEIYISSDKSKVIIVSPINRIDETITFTNALRYEYKNLLIIGNGFDLDLGLKTSYRDFANSRIFKRLYLKRTQDKLAKNNPKPSLIDFLYGKKFIEKWFDIELALLEYVSVKPDGSYVNNTSEDESEYKQVCKALKEYLGSLLRVNLDQTNKMVNSPAGQLLQHFYSHNSNNIVYSFNYTPLQLINKIVIGREPLDSIRVHGGLEEKSIFNKNVEKDSIILGIETKDIRKIAPGYTFMLKSNNSAYKSTSIASDLLNSQNIIFFGHSLNQMDFGYFEEYFKMLTTNTDKDRRLIIITRDEPSRITLLDNIRKAGISVRDIFAHTQVDFILTSNLSNVKSEDGITFNNLLNNM